MIDVGEAINECVVLTILLAAMIADGVLTKFLDFATLSFEVSHKKRKEFIELLLCFACNCLEMILSSDENVSFILSTSA